MYCSTHSSSSAHASGSLVCCVRQGCIRTTDSQHQRPVAANLLQRDFSARAANEKWVGDIVGIWIDEGWLYLAALLDTYSRFIVGWPMSQYRDEALVTAALHMALARRDLPT